MHLLCSDSISLVISFVKFAVSRGRGFTHVCVDHRPTKVLVSGYEEDEKTEVLAHFAVSLYVCLINLSDHFLVTLLRVILFFTSSVLKFSELT
jgi:hypothetical protein